MEGLEQRFVAGKRAPVLRQLTQVHDHRLDGVGRVDHLTTLWRVVNERNQASPVAPPALENGLIFPVPAGLKFAYALLGLFGCSGMVDMAQIGRHRLASFPYQCRK